MDPRLFTLIMFLFDVVDRIATKHFDSKEDMEEYIEKRNSVRKEIVALANSLAEDEPEEDENESPPDSSEAQVYQPRTEPEQDPSRLLEHKPAEEPTDAATAAPREG